MKVYKSKLIDENAIRHYMLQINLNILTISLKIQM